MNNAKTKISQEIITKLFLEKRGFISTQGYSRVL